MSPMLTVRGVRLGGDGEAAVGGRDGVGEAGGGQRIGGAVADDLAVERVELVDVVLDDDDVALGDVELPGDRRAVERSADLSAMVYWTPSMRNWVFAGGHRVGVAAADHRVRLHVGVDDVDGAVDRELVGVDRIGLAVAGDAEVVAAAVLVEGVEVPAQCKHLRCGHQRVGRWRAESSRRSTGTSGEPFTVYAPLLSRST